MKTIRMSIDEDLLKRVNQTREILGITRSTFIRQALEMALRKLSISEME